MENKKKWIGAVFGLACVILIVVFLLTNCGNQAAEEPKETTVATEVTETTAETTVETTEETTEPTEETTEPTEETTEPTEETTAPTEGSSSGGNSKPGGTGGFTGGSIVGGDDDSGDDSTEPTAPTEPEVPAAGTQTNAYTESLGVLPDTVSTVKIPTDATISYNIYNADGTVLTIADENAYVVYNEQTIEAVEGVVTVALAAPEAGKPVSLQLGNRSGAEESYVLNYALPLGSANNPEILESIEEIKATLEAGDADGYFYSYTALQNGTLSLSVSSVDPADVEYDIILTKTVTPEDEETGEEGETPEEGAPAEPVVTTAKLSESTDGTVSLDMEVGETVTIQVLVTTEDTAAQIIIAGVFTAISGTEDNPALLVVPENTITIPAGSTIYYQGYVNGMIMTLNGENVSVLHNGTEYTAENGVIQLEAVGASMREPCKFAITNHAEENATYTVTFEYPIGNSGNPAELVLGTNTAVVKANTEGYFYTWTAGWTGVLTVTMGDANSQGWSYSISNLTSGIYGNFHYSSDSPVVTSESITVNEGDEIQISVNTWDSVTYTAPAGEVAFTAEFMIGIGTEEHPYQLTDVTQETEIQVGAGETVYIQSRSLGMVFNLTGENVEVTHGGTTHQAENGVVSFAVTAGDMYNPPVFAITNTSDEAKGYNVIFTFPVGTMENPQQIVLGTNSAKLEANDMDGYFLSWIAAEDGELTVTMSEEMETEWFYYVNFGDHYGEHHNSAQDPVVSSQTVSVAAGDEVMVSVNTFNPNGNDTPAGTIVFDVAFSPAAETVGAFILRDPEITETEPVEDDAEIQETVAEETVPETEPAVENETEAVEETIPETEPQAEPETETAAETEEEEIVKGTLAHPKRFYDLLLTEADAEEPNEVAVVVEEGSDGYFYRWKAKQDGVLTFDIGEYPEDENIRVDITLFVETEDGEVKEEDMFSLWNYDEEAEADVESETVSIRVKEGQEIIIRVTATDTELGDACVAAELTIFGIFTAGEEEAVTDTAEPEVPGETEPAPVTEPAETEAVAEPATELVTEPAADPETAEA